MRSLKYFSILLACAPALQSQTITPEPVAEVDVPTAPYMYNGRMSVNGASGSASLVANGVIARTGFPAGLDHDALVKAFVAHSEAVKETIPSSQLLEFEVKNGWGPLCAFLEVPVPDEAFKKALAFMKRCRGSDGGYGYTSAGSGKPTLTAIGSLCLSLAKEKDSKGYKASLNYLKKRMTYRDRFYPYYFEYYMSQALFHADETAWNEWNQKNIRYMATIQNADGSFPGNPSLSFSLYSLISFSLSFLLLLSLYSFISSIVPFSD